MSSGQPQGALPVFVFSNNPQSADGAFVVGGVDCEQLGLKSIAVLLDPARDRIALMAPCGCSVQISLAHMLVELAQRMAVAHAGGSSATH